jgi:single-strand DNA-binding protein
LKFSNDINVCVIAGEIVREPEIKHSGELTIAQYTVKTGNAYVSTVSFGKQAEFVEKYLHEGARMSVIGTLKVESYKKKDGKWATAATVISEKLSFHSGADINDIILVGRATTNATTRDMQNGTKLVTFTVASARKSKSTEDAGSDFIDVTFYESNNGMEKTSKGETVTVTGSIITGSYVNKDGDKVYTTKVLARHAEITKHEKNPNTSGQTENYSNDLPWK